jgi:hypothetical protein
MPGCKEEASKIIACPEIVNGVVLGPHQFHVCSKHKAIEVYDRIRTTLSEKAAAAQLVNPFQDVKLQKNPAPPSK